MTARPIGKTSGTLTCDAKTPSGTCRAEFESFLGEIYLRCLERAVKAGWKTDGRSHFCPEHAWLMR